MGEPALKRGRLDFDVADATRNNVCLVVKDRKFYCNKQTLVQHTERFRALFAEDESKYEYILEDLDNPDEFLVFLKMINGSICLDDINIHGVVHICNIWDAPVALDNCVKYLTKESNMSRQERLFLAETYQLEELKESILSSVNNVADLHPLLPPRLDFEATSASTKDMLLKTALRVLGVESNGEQIQLNIPVSAADIIAVLHLMATEAESKVGQTRDGASYFCALGRAQMLVELLHLLQAYTGGQTRDPAEFMTKVNGLDRNSGLEMYRRGLNSHAQTFMSALTQAQALGMPSAFLFNQPPEPYEDILDIERVGEDNDQPERRPIPAQLQIYDVPRPPPPQPRNAPEPRFEMLMGAGVPLFQNMFGMMAGPAQGMAGGEPPNLRNMMNGLQFNNPHQDFLRGMERPIEVIDLSEDEEEEAGENE